MVCITYINIYLFFDPNIMISPLRHPVDRHQPDRQTIHTQTQEVYYIIHGNYT